MFRHYLNKLSTEIQVLIKNKNIDEFVNKITMFLKLKKNEKNTLSKNAWNFYMNQYCNIKNEEVIF